MRQYDGQSERSRIDIIRRLGKVDVIVRMDNVVTTTRKSQVLQRSVCDYLVDVHVRGRSRATLEHINRELGNQVARDNIIAGGGNCVSFAG